MNNSIEWVDPERLSANDWNPNKVDPENEEKLEASIDRFGMFKPVVVRDIDGEMEILAGEHRAMIAKRKGLSTPVFNLGEIDDETAKRISLADNERYGSDDTGRLSELLDSLTDTDDLANFLPMSEADLNDMLASESIDLDDLDLPDEEEPEPEPEKVAPKTHTMMRFKVPVEDAETVSELIARVQKEQSFDTGDSLTNAGDALVHIINKLREE